MALDTLTIGEDQKARGAILFEDAGHRFIWLGLIEEEGDESVQVNQFAIEHGGRVALLDPGGVLAFPHVVAALSRFVPLERIDALFYSHQDPDVCSGIALWMQITQAKAYISKLWTRFVPHFGRFPSSRLVGIEDGGMAISVGGSSITAVPAHFMHSVGNFMVYDPASKILFTGDVGASVFPGGEAKVIVDDFQELIPYTEGFHRRYMTSNAACRHWVNMVRRMDVEMLAPQHGAMLRGPAVGQFLDWLSRLECGVDRIGEVYGGKR